MTQKIRGDDEEIYVTHLTILNFHTHTQQFGLIEYHIRPAIYSWIISSNFMHHLARRLMIMMLLWTIDCIWNVSLYFEIPMEKCQRCDIYDFI